MMNVFLLLFVLLKSVSLVVCVPHNPTSALADELKIEFSSMKTTVKLLSEQWEKWNTLFITSLEPRITSTASTLASIDSNIHNLQERAHVWDTFQLHVSAWNEQLASIDRKIDIISKGQEKLMTIDNKINAILAMEYKLDTTIKALSNIENTVGNFDALIHMKSSKTPHDNLFNEFTARGVLSSIKTVEKKLDRLLMANQNKYLKSVEHENDKSKLQLKCSSSKFVEDILNDISSKVDVIFDSFSDSKIFIDDTGDDNDYSNMELTEGSGHSSKKHPNINLLKKVIKKAIQPCKQTNQILEEVLSRNIRSENVLLQIVDKEHMLLDLLNKEISLRKILDNTVPSTEDLIENINVILDSYFSEQRVNFENILNKFKANHYESFHRSESNLTNNSIQPHSPDSQPAYIFQNYTLVQLSSTTEKNTFYEDKIIPTWKPVLDPGKSSCEDLSFDDNSGVYIFETHLGGRDKIFSNKRYCEIRNDGLWTVVQRRDNYTTQHNFSVSWEEYKNGFGDLHKDFWMGNELLYELSKSQPLILRIELYDFENNFAWAEYNIFKVGDEESKYSLIVDGYTGNASDSFSSHNGSAFSTFDNTNDQAPVCCPCSLSYGGGWWFDRCFESNLNGIYYRNPSSNGYFRGIIWEHWLGNYSLKRSTMMVKSKGKIFYQSPFDEPVDNVESLYTTDPKPTFEDP